MSNLSPNTNDAASDKWRLTFEGLELILFSQKVIGFDIPDVSCMGTKGPSGDHVLSLVSGDRMEYSQVNFMFVVDEDYANYRTLFNWMKSNCKKDLPVERDFAVDLLNNRGQNQGVSLDFEHARPTSLGSFTLDTSGAEPVLICTVTLDFQDMDFRD